MCFIFFFIAKHFYTKPASSAQSPVETVFHEFGHALQHMLTKQDEGFVAGIRGIEWDAVELPSVHGKLVLSQEYSFEHCKAL
ncbi:hypothetical protein GUJ93_ZPchr0008g13219 [Zizania palustris]|uniref:Peptidase M3A/M3B catalytic domain-containing protein n=1 Tax=Zizania palustris TaxID=103762 RepID=A0A8J5RD66_ZIZPA|nr:hypothetical protein GUJ93_ZPchr0008g13219 [Zizania palustris]